MPKPAKAENPLASPPNAPGMVRVWDLFVRAFHWALVLSFAVAWLTSHTSEAVHHVAGYAAAGLVVLRLLWGLVGTHYARFGQFAREPRTVLKYLAEIANGREARYLGHNPAGGAMIIALLLAMALTAFTGWMMTTDQYWGVEWVSRAHDWIAHGLLVLVCLHLVGVTVASLRHRENLVGAMLTGWKRAPGKSDIT